jgi:hypothetical protein
MTCENSINNWTVKIIGATEEDGLLQSGDFEFRPESLSIERNRNKYNYARVGIPQEVARTMRPQITHPDGGLSQHRRANILYDGSVHSILYYKPEWVTIGENTASMELHDRHKAADDGAVDYRRINTVKGHYEDVISNINNQFVSTYSDFKNDAFEIPDWKYNEETELRLRHLNFVSPPEGGAQSDRAYGSPSELFDAKFRLSFDVASPQRAIERLNKVFGLRSWFEMDGNIAQIKIGIPENDPTRFISAPDDKRVLRHKEPQMTLPKAPIKRVMVENSGAWAEGEAEQGEGEFRVGVAERTDIEDGDSFAISNTNAPTDNLPKVAKARMVEEYKKGRSGSVTLDPARSGSDGGSPENLSNGDYLRTIPEDNHFENPDKKSGQPGNYADNLGEGCGNFIYNTDYLVTGIKDRVEESGRWTVDVDLTAQPDITMKSELRLYDPREDELVPDNQVELEEAEKTNLLDGLF